MRIFPGLLFLLVLIAAFSHDAAAVTQALKDACRDDYQRYCSQHEVGSDAVRECMSDAFDKLSDPCVTVILGSGEATKSTEPRKRAARHARHGKYARHAHHARNTRYAHRRTHAHRVASHVRHGRHVVRRFVARVVRRVRSVLR